MDKLYTMRQASELVGMTVRYLQILDKKGKIECVRTPGGRRRIPESEIMRLRGKIKRDCRWAIYARVSSHEQKNKGDLQRQIEYLQKLVPTEAKEIKIISEIGSSLNDKRKGLKTLMDGVIAGEITDIAITDKDRLTRFGKTRSGNNATTEHPERQKSRAQRLQKIQERGCSSLPKSYLCSQRLRRNGTPPRFGRKERLRPGQRLPPGRSQPGNRLFVTYAAHWSVLR